MYKLMIVDDELMARDVLKTVIEENFNQIAVVCEAVNGKQAIEYNRQHKPDIILMDIRIPGINGIEASRKILEEDPDTVILIITAYDEFSYIQQALDLGIKGYILKPIKDEEVAEKINKCLKCISESRMNSDFNKKFEKTVSIIKPLIQKEIVSSIITGYFDGDEVKSYAGFLHENIEAGFFMLISYDTSCADHFNDAIRDKINRDKINEICLKFIPLTRKCLFGETIGNIQVVFFPADKEEDEKVLENEAKVIALNIKNRIMVMASLNVSIGIGRLYSGFENLKCSYNEAYTALRKAAAKNEIIQFQAKEHENTFNTFQFPIRYENELMEYLNIGDINKSKELADTILKYLLGSSLNLELIREYVSQLISIINRTILQMGTGTAIANSLGNVSGLYKINNIDEMKIWYKNNIYSLIESIAGLKQKSGDKQIAGMVKEYINKHYYKNITLDNIAEEIGFGASYISRLFKEEFGVNFIDYITDRKIGRAREMLTSGEKNIKKISEAIGYSDVNYFCRVFKKVTGLTTSQYRLQNLNIAGEDRGK